jgi:SAM-dependent methyltransferase
MSGAAAAASLAAAFDREAGVYDAGFGSNPVGRLFRFVFQQRLLELFPPGSRLLDVGCGTGEDALFLASRGRSVVGIDVAAGMIDRARRRSEACGREGARVTFEALAAEDAAQLPAPFDGAYSDFGALNGADLRAAGRGLAAVLRSGAPLLLSLMGPDALPDRLARAALGRGEPRLAAKPRVSGVSVDVRYPPPDEARAQLGDAFSWRRGFALGVLMPGPHHAGWAIRHPQAFALLAAAEESLRGLSLLRGLGDHYVLEGCRR